MFRLSYIKIVLRLLNSALSNRFSNGKFKLSYIIEPAEWSIRMDGKYITSSLNNQNLIKSRITTIPFGIRNQIIHFGSMNTFFRKDGFCKPHKSNKIVLTWFHVVPNDERNILINTAQDFIELIHTSCTLTKKSLTELGVNKEKIVVIPLGVDLNLFRPPSAEEKRKLRKELNIPENRVVIGSFQKDGVGWGRGLVPKLIKGPDIFVEVVDKLSKNYPIFVLLVGPARGYVEEQLLKRNIPFKSIGYLKNFNEVAKYYRALDIYLITSRIGGGPKQILEAWASGIPVVATKIGMILDIAKDGKDALLAEVGDIGGIVRKVKKIIENKTLREKLIENGLRTVQNYSWDLIAKRYFEEIYSRLL